MNSSLRMTFDRCNVCCISRYVGAGQNDYLQISRTHRKMSDATLSRFECED